MYIFLISKRVENEHEIILGGLAEIELAIQYQKGCILFVVVVVEVVVVVPLVVVEDVEVVVLTVLVVMVVVYVVVVTMVSVCTNGPISSSSSRITSEQSLGCSQAEVLKSCSAPPKDLRPSFSRGFSELLSDQFRADVGE